MKRRTCIKEKGITLIALVITIIIMLILAGVIISSVTSNKGILSRAKGSREVYDESKAEEQVMLLMHEYAMASAEAETKGETLTLEDYLKGKKADGTITDYKVNEDGSAEITIGDKTVKVNKDLSVADNTNKGTTGGDSDSGNKGSTIGDNTGKVTDRGTGTTLTNDSASYSKITQEGLIYADLDGNPLTAEGLVVATTSDGSAVTATSEMPTGYEMKDYTGESKTAAGKIITTSTTEGNNFYVLALADYDSTNNHSWYKNAYRKMLDSTPTSTDFGLKTYDDGVKTVGEHNTEVMLEKWKNDYYGKGDSNDIWGLLQTRQTGWFVPSRDEWNTFIANLRKQGLVTANSVKRSNYYNFGVNEAYWSSSIQNDEQVYECDFFGGYKYYTSDVRNTNDLRLCTTF